MDDALAAGELSPGAASKMAGALNWAAQHSFHRLGRGMLLPLYQQSRGRASAVGPQLRLALRWWQEVFTHNLEQLWAWNRVPTKWAHVYADARGSPPRVAAVLFIDGLTFYTDCKPPEHALAAFEKRSDNQIMGLELLALALALSSFGPLLKDRRFFLWSDNTGAQHAAESGRAKSFDHSCLARCLWSKIATLNADVSVQRVPTKENIADLPSREDYHLLEILGAKRLPAKMDKMFLKLGAWDSISILPA